jgi:hypothetical protein
VSAVRGQVQAAIADLAGFHALAVASNYCDVENVQTELAMEGLNEGRSVYLVGRISEA